LIWIHQEQMDPGFRRDDGKQTFTRTVIVHSDSTRCVGHPGANESEHSIMELVLLQKVKNLGNLGDKVKVKPGYGRNFLVPHGKAVAATEANLADFEKRRADYEAKANQQLSGAEARRAQLENATITLKANASPEGKLFGSVGPRDIAEAFTAAGTTIEKSEVVMAEGPIRHIGEFEVQIHLHADVHTTVKVQVVADE